MREMLLDKFKLAAMIYLYPNAGECGAIYGITRNYQMYIILPRNVCYVNN